MINRIQWLGHGSFRIQGPPLIYINPWRVARSSLVPDAILVSNDQYEHCSPGDVEKLRGPDTVVVSNPGASAVLNDDSTVLRPWQSMNIGSGRVTAVPAYTFTDHNPVSKGGLGFVISIDYFDIYYASSTDFIPELQTICCDIAILPVGAGQGTMTVDRAMQLVDVLKPTWIIPSHWGSLGGTMLDVQAFEQALGGRSKLVMLEKMR